MGVMATALRQRLIQDRFEGPVHEAVLNLLVASASLQEAHPAGHARCEIARRMIERAPDLTRMIDRLQRRGLVERARSDQDRRHSITRITRGGLELVERMAPAVAALHRTVSRRLTRPEAVTLSRLCEKLYAED